MKEYTFEELMKYDEMRQLFELAVKEHYYSMTCESINFVYGEDILDYFEEDEVETPWKTYEEFLEADEKERNEWVEENCAGLSWWGKWFEKYGDGHLYALSHYHTDIKKEYEFYAKSDIEEFWDLILEDLEENDWFYNLGIDKFGYDKKGVIKWAKSFCPVTK